MLRLRQLSYADKRCFNRSTPKWYVNGEPIVPSNTDMSRYESFESMVDRLNSTEVDEDWVPTTTLFCFEDDDCWCSRYSSLLESTLSKHRWSCRLCKSRRDKVLLR